MISIYNDIDIEMTRQTDGDVKQFIDVDAIKSSIINILTTRIGTRRMVPGFGSELDMLLFEPMDKTTAERLGEGILHAIEVWEDRITITNVEIDVNYDKLYYNVRVSFTVKGRGTNVDEITFILRKI